MVEQELNWKKLNLYGSGTTRVRMNFQFLSLNSLWVDWVFAGSKRFIFHKRLLLRFQRFSYALLLFHSIRSNVNANGSHRDAKWNGTTQTQSERVNKTENQINKWFSDICCGCQAFVAYFRFTDFRLLLSPNSVIRLFVRRQPAVDDSVPKIFSSGKINKIGLLEPGLNLICRLPVTRS